MMQWITDYDTFPELSENDLQGRRHRYTYQNQVPLNAQEDAPLVNYIHYELSNKKGKVTFRNSWVTDSTNAIS